MVNDFGYRPNLLETRIFIKILDAALALVALEQPKLPSAALPQDFLSPAETRIFRLFGFIPKQPKNTFPELRGRCDYRAVPQLPADGAKNP
jgi:hypothetical protein